MGGNWAPPPVLLLVYDARLLTAPVLPLPPLPLPADDDSLSAPLESICKPLESPSATRDDDGDETAAATEAAAAAAASSYLSQKTCS